MKSKWSSGVSVVTFTVFTCSQAWGQVGIGVSGEASSEGVGAESEVAAPEPEPEPEYEPPPPPPPPPPPVEPVFVPVVEDTRTDHQRVVGSFAVGLLGTGSMLIGTGAGGGTGTQAVSAPIVGVRYWMSEGVGLDLGLGIGMSDATAETQTGVEAEAPGPAVVMVHAGLPLALADHQHFVFQVVPELNFGMGGNTIEVGGGADDQVSRGMHFDLGVRAGAEVHFGFIDVPQLSLQAGVGLRLSYDQTTYEDGAGTGETAQMSFGTGPGGDPWDIFTSSIAALYYF